MSKHNYFVIFLKKINLSINNSLKKYLNRLKFQNLLIISRNVIYKNLENIMKADVLELNTTTKDTKIFMYNSSEQVNVTNID